MIRLLLGLLIAGNVVLLLWIQYGDSRGNDSQQLTRKPDFGDIRLLREVSAPELPMPEQLAPPDPEGEVVVPAPQQVLSEPKTEPEPAIVYCGELGPVRSRNMAEGYRRVLSQSEAAALQVEVRTGQETTGYWAMIPAQPDVASAEAMLKRLQAAGLEDLWLIRKGELENAISLGLYTEERYARRHADKVRKLGFEPTIVPKKKKARVYWVVFSGVAEIVLAEFDAKKLPANTVLHKKVCKQTLTGN